MKRFFSFDPNDRMRLHYTAEEAKAEAQHAFNLYLYEAGEGWDDNVDEVMWGEIKECVQVTSRRPYDPDLDEYSGIDPELCDEIVNMDLLPIHAE